MTQPPRNDDDEAVRLTPAGVLASVCLGVTVLAEVGAVVLPWGLRSSYDSVPFALYAADAVETRLASAARS